MIYRFHLNNLKKMKILSAFSNPQSITSFLNNLYLRFERFSILQFAFLNPAKL